MVTCHICAIQTFTLYHTEEEYIIFRKGACIEVLFYHLCVLNELHLFTILNLPPAVYTPSPSCRQTETIVYCHPPFLTCQREEILKCGSFGQRSLNSTTVCAGTCDVPQLSASNCV